MIATLHAHGRNYEIDVERGGLVGDRILEHGTPYEPWLLEWIYERGFTGTAVDVGAHIGNHTLWLAMVCGLRVEAFEPLTYAALRENVERNGLLGQVHVHDCALGARHCWAHVVGKGKLAVTDLRDSSKQNLAVRPLDGYELTDVSVMKIDVEDMEPYVLLGATLTIERCRPVICAEARDDAAHVALRKILRPWGYTMTQRFSRGTPVECWEPA